MLEDGKIADIQGIGSPGNDGFVNIPVPKDKLVSITFTTAPSELTQIKVKPTNNAQPDDIVRITVTLTDTDGVNTDLVSDISISISC